MSKMSAQCVRLPHNAITQLQTKYMHEHNVISRKP